MEWISGWIQGIIVAVMISTIIEMILPEGNCKKYIKVVIGVYILASILTPVVTKITGKEFNLASIFDLDEYIETSSKNSHQDVNKSQNEQIQGIYQNSLKSDMRQKIEAKGYEVLNIALQISNDGEYTIEKIQLEVTKKEIEQNSKQENIEESNRNNNLKNIEKIESIDEIKVQVGNKSQKEKTSKVTEKMLTMEEQKELKQYLSSVYEVAETKININ